MLERRSRDGGKQGHVCWQKRGDEYSGNQDLSVRKGNFMPARMIAKVDEDIKWKDKCCTEAVPDESPNRGSRRWN